MTVRSSPEEMRKIAASVRHDVVPMAGVEHIAKALEWGATEIEQLRITLRRLLYRVDEA